MEKKLPNSTKVVVIGGGAGGATAARYIAKDSKGKIDVTLVEPSRMYYTCFFSNLYLGGVKSIDDLGHSYGKIAAGGVNVVHDWAVGVDRDSKTVSLASGSSVPYDKLILSPGIDFIDGAVEGWNLSSQNAMPHAYKGGSQTELLKAQIASMPQGGTYAMVAPPNPYRCPPGPYERISMVAHYLKSNNPTAKIIVADPKPKFSKQGLFQEGWAKHYDGMIEWISSDFGGGNVSVDPNEMTIKEMADKIVQATNSKSKIIHVPLPEDDPKIRQPDITLARKYLNWKPVVSLDQGLQSTLEYFKNQLKT